MAAGLAGLIGTGLITFVGVFEQDLDAASRAPRLVDQLDLGLEQHVP